MDKEQLEKLKSILEFLEEDIVTPKDIEQFITVILKVISEAKNNLETLSQEHLQILREIVPLIEAKKEDIITSIDSITEKKKQDISKDIIEVRREFSDSIKEAQLNLKQISEFLIEVKNIKSTPGKNGKQGEKGKDADEQKIIDSVLAQIKFPEYKEVMLDNGEEIVAKINQLATDDDDLKIDASHIKNLEKYITEFKRPSGGGGGRRGITTADNGLTLAGSNVQLGGDLIKDTTISGVGSFSLLMNNLLTGSLQSSVVTTGYTSGIDVGLTANQVTVQHMNNTTNVGTAVLFGLKNLTFRSLDIPNGLSAVFTTDLTSGIKDSQLSLADSIGNTKSRINMRLDRVQLTHEYNQTSSLYNRTYVDTTRFAYVSTRNALTAERTYMYFDNSTNLFKFGDMDGSGMAFTGDIANETFDLNRRTIVTNTFEDNTGLSGLFSNTTIRNTGHSTSEVNNSDQTRLIVSDNFDHSGPLGTTGLFAKFNSFVHSGSGTIFGAIGTFSGIYGTSTGTLTNAIGYTSEILKSTSSTVITSAYGFLADIGNSTNNIGTAVGFVVSSLGAAATFKYGFVCDIDGSSNILREVQIKQGAALKLYDADSSHYSAWKAHATTTASVEYTMPAAGPASNGMALVSTTAGATSWAAAGGITLGAIGSTPNANGASLNGNVLNLEPASGSFGGIVTTGFQVFTGQKAVYNNSIDASTDVLNFSAVLNVNDTANNANTGLYIASQAFAEVQDDFDHASLILAGYFTSNHAGTGALNILGGAGALAENSSTGTIDTAAGLNAGVNNNSTGDINAALAVIGSIENFAGGDIVDAGSFLATITNNSSGTITTANGLVVSIENLGAGSIGTAVGVSVDFLDAATKVGFSSDIYESTNILRQLELTSESSNHQNTYHKVLYVSTTDATPTELTDDGAAGSGTGNRITVPTNGTLSVVVNIGVKQASSANSKQFLRQFVISNNGGTTALQGAVTVLGTDIGSVALATATVTITANDTDDCIKIEGTGVAGTNLRWTANIVSAEIIYA